MQLSAGALAHSAAAFFLAGSHNAVLHDGHAGEPCAELVEQESMVPNEPRARCHWSQKHFLRDASVHGDSEGLRHCWHSCATMLGATFCE